MKKVILIHGYTSSPNRKKYQIIAKELEELGVEYAIPAFPGGEHPHSKEWLEILDKEVAASKLPVVLVGHSLGTRAALLYLDQYDQHADTVILIAAFNNDVEKNREEDNGNYADFFEYSLDMEKVKSRADRFIVIHSTDDDAIDYQQAVNISKDLGAELITHDNMGHFSGEERAAENAKYFLEAIKSVL